MRDRTWNFWRSINTVNLTEGQGNSNWYQNGKFNSVCLGNKLEKIRIYKHLNTCIISTFYKIDKAKLSYLNMNLIVQNESDGFLLLHCQLDLWSSPSRMTFLPDPFLFDDRDTDIPSLWIVCAGFIAFCCLFWWHQPI